MTRPTLAGLPQDLVWDYLMLLGLTQEPPSLEALARLAHAHILAVPFENVSSILRAHASAGAPAPPVDPREEIAAWSAGRAGGVCFEVADTFCRLLIALGYQAHPVLCESSFPGSHQAIAVVLDNNRYLVDAGNGAPFFEPIPLDGEFEIHSAGLGYRFRPGDTQQEWLQDRRIDGDWSPFCRYDLTTPEAGAREAAYQRHHTPGRSWVVDSLRLIRCGEDEVWVLFEDQLTHYTSDEKRKSTVTAEDYENLARDVFHLPALPIRRALAVREELKRRVTA